MKVVFYTIDCDHCEMLESKLKQKNISYEECRDIEIMKEKDFTEAPMLEVDDKCFNFVEAMEWLSLMK